jgi:hypothetical protein
MTQPTSVAGLPAQDETVRRRATWLAVALGLVALAATLIYFGPEGLPRVLAGPAS